MRLRTVAKLGVVLSVVLFCVAVGFYGFARLSMTDKGREINLFSLVPSDCIGVLESDNINYFLNEFPQLNYSDKLGDFQFPGLFNFILGGLTEYTTNNAHGLSSRMSRLLVSFHAPGSPRDQVVYFRMGAGDEKALGNMLQDRALGDYLPKKEKYRGKTIYIYPLTNDEFLAAYSESGFFVVSYQKRLIEEVIDAREDKTSLESDPVFAKVLTKKKSHNFLTLYGRTTSMPFLQNSDGCWSEFDFHMNSDVVYLTGDTFLPDTCDCMQHITARLREVPDVKEDSIVISANRDAMAGYMDEIYDENGTNSHTLFDECVTNLSREAVFMLVADMCKVSENPERFKPYLPPFILENASVFDSFILSTQLSMVNDKLSHIMVLTYKD
ncbi:hypothetical protein [Phocaeicola sp.]